MTYQEFKEKRERGEILPGSPGASPFRTGLEQECVDCAREGRGKVMMPYQGFFYSMQTVMVQEFTEDDVEWVDRKVPCPYDVWVCKHGHVLTDGY